MVSVINLALNKIQLYAWVGQNNDNKMVTFEKIKLWTPNNYYIVPYGKNNHLIPNLSGLDNA